MRSAHSDGVSVKLFLERVWAAGFLQSLGFTTVPNARIPNVRAFLKVCYKRS